MMTRLPVTFAVGLGAAAAAVVGAAGAAVGLAAGAAVAAAAVVGAAGLGASVGLGAAGAVVAAGAGAWPHAATIVITTPDVKPYPRRPRRVRRRVVGFGKSSSAPITPPHTVCFVYVDCGLRLPAPSTISGVGPSSAAEGTRNAKGSSARAPLRSCRHRGPCP